jgi:hypothetical protein
MPIRLRYGRTGTGSILRSNSQDFNPVGTFQDNVVQGVDSGVGVGEGWSIPPSRSGEWFGSRDFYPAQVPTFYKENTVTKLSGYDYSNEYNLYAKYPLGGLGRVEDYTRSPWVRENRIAIKYSFYLPDTFDTDQVNPAILMQCHSYGTPSISLYLSAGGFLTLRLYKSGSESVPFNFAAATRNTWHHLTFFITWSKSLSGLCAMYYGNSLATSYLRSGSVGSYTYSRGLRTVNATQGTLPNTTVIEGTTVAKLDFRGWTLTTDPLSVLADLSLKWGWYKWTYADFVNSAAVSIANFEDGDTAEDAVLINPSNPAGPDYLAPGLRQLTMYSHIEVATFDEGETYFDIFRLLNNGDSPIDAPDYFGTDTPPVVTTYPLTVTAATGGTVNTAGGNFPNGTSVSLVATPSTGYIFGSWRIGTVGGAIVPGSSQSFTYTTGASAVTLVAVFIEDEEPIPPVIATGDRFFARFESEPIV